MANYRLISPALTIAASRLAHYNGGASLSFRYLDHNTGETATETLTQRAKLRSIQMPFCNHGRLGAVIMPGLAG